MLLRTPAGQEYRGAIYGVVTGVKFQTEQLQLTQQAGKCGSSEVCPPVKGYVLRQPTPHPLDGVLGKLGLD